MEHYFVCGNIMGPQKSWVLKKGEKVDLTYALCKIRVFPFKKNIRKPLKMLGVTCRKCLGRKP